jgi:hypothetical protein
MLYASPFVAWQSPCDSSAKGKTMIRKWGQGHWNTGTWNEVLPDNPEGYYEVVWR